ncbi:hypothetical protein ACSBR2_033065 [Camellia fascicularis]
MGQKKGNNGGEKNNNNGGDGEKKGGDGIITVVLKMDMHCEGCASKMKKCVCRFEGVESVKGDCVSNKLTVIGKVDPVKLREMVEQKAKKKVELVSPLPKKDNKKGGGGGGGGGGGEQKGEGKPEKKADEKKTKDKEPPVTTAVMKMDLHCQGCIKKIQKTITKTKGYHEMSIDNQKNLITVKGTMDMKALADALKQRLKKPVEIVPPKKEGGGDKKEKGGGGGGGGGGKGKKDGGGEGGGNGNGGGGQGEQNIIQHVMHQNPYMNGYGSGYPIDPYPYHHVQAPMGHYPYQHVQAPMDHYPYQVVQAPQMFSDENPNACSVM